MRIALFGLGIIGATWARHWADDGHVLRTWNRTPQPAAPGFHADAAVAAHEAELLAIVVSDGAAVQGVLDAVLPVLAPDAVVAVHSTIGVDEVHAVAARVRAAGGRYLDMPFTGSKAAAERRQVVYYVGGIAADLAAVAPAYQSIARAILSTGATGSAMALKLAMNLNIAGVYQTLAESLATARAAGLDDAMFFQALGMNVSHSGLADLKQPKLACSDWSPHFATKHMAKDLHLALRLADALGLELPQTAAVTAAYDRALAEGQGEADFAVLAAPLLAAARRPG
jgi:3-hydroxyisobutyrate dehydrogenase-like beta-hydroxyacid dehydrogenase